MADTYLAAWLRAFGTTVVIEAGIACLIVSRKPFFQTWTAAVFAQIVSHPAVWFIFPRLHLRRPVFLAVAEFWAFAIEAIFYRRFLPGVSWRKAVLLSLVTNGASVAAGWCLREAGWL